MQTGRQPVSWPNGERVREHMINSQLANERAMKEAAQQVVADFRSVLFFVAQQAAGEKARDLLRQDPQVFNAWSPADWRSFFEGVFGASPWGPAVQKAPAEDERHAAEIRQLQEAAGFWQQKAQALERDLLAAQAKGPRQVDPAAAGAPRPAVPAPIAEKPAPRSLPGVHAQIATDLQGWSVPIRPVRFLEQVSQEQTQWRRQSMAMYVLATYGISPRVELEHLVGMAEGLKSRPGSLRTAFELLIARGLLVGEIVRLERDGFKSALSLLQLSEEGRALCQITGWKTVDSEWERLKATQPETTTAERIFGVISLAMHARLRGWEAKVRPEPAGERPCDLRLSRDRQAYWVEMALDGQEPPEHWARLAAAHGSINFCAVTQTQRARLVTACLSRGWGGQAADLETLAPVRMAEIGSQTPLWSQKWPGG